MTHPSKHFKQRLSQRLNVKHNIKKTAMAILRNAKPIRAYRKQNSTHIKVDPDALAWGLYVIPTYIGWGGHRYAATIYEVKEVWE